jgi:hypothetical protein
MTSVLSCVIAFITENRAAPWAGDEEREELTEWAGKSDCEDPELFADTMIALGWNEDLVQSASVVIRISRP